MPASIKSAIPEKQKKIPFSKKSHNRKILLVSGCVQPDLKPNIDSAARVIFDRLDIECIETPSRRCCGALSHHLNAEDEAITIIKANIDDWWPLVENNTIEAICMTASGCGVVVKEYEQLLGGDKDYAEKAKIISQLYKDPSEIVTTEYLADKGTLIKQLKQGKFAAAENKAIAFHPPCTLQHGMQLKNIIEPILSDCGFTLLPFKDKHLCCGSAGTYSITQKKLSQQLLNNKLSHIEKNQPEIIVTANIGCQLHMQSGTTTPVQHWLELLV